MQRRWIAWLLILAGFALRLLLHDVHGLEGDDAFSLALSRTPWGELVSGLMRLELDVHPPLHFLALKAWTGWAGTSLLSLRLLNILLDLLSGALVWHLAYLVTRRKLEPTLALGVWAVSPTLIFGTWLVRMYTLSGLLVMVAAVCALHTLRPKADFYLWAGLAAVGSLAAMYTHILGLIVAGATGLVLLIVGGRRGTRQAVSVVGLFALVGLLYVPFLQGALTLANSAETLGAQVNPAQAADLPIWLRLGQSVWVAFFHRLATPTTTLIWVGVLFAALGYSVWRQSGRGTALAAISLMTFVGLGLLVWGLGFKARYVVPFVSLWLVYLVVGLGRARVAWMVVPLIAVGMAWGLWQNLQYGWRDDWTALAGFVETYTLPGDAVLVVPDWGQEAMRYHYGGEAPVRGFFPALTDGLDLDAAFGDYVSGYERVWLVQYQPMVSDPAGLAPAWLAARSRSVTQAFPSGAVVTLYDMGQADGTLSDQARRLEVQFGEALALRGVTLPDGLTTPAVNTRLYDESGRILVRLHWETLQQNLSQTPRVRLTDSFGQVYGAALASAQEDSVRRPVVGWQPGKITPLYYNLNINPATPPGVYNIEVMVLDESGDPLPTTGADAGQNWAIAGRVVIQN